MSYKDTIILLFVITFVNFHIIGVNGYDDPDIYRNVSELISSKGYPVENYVVQTKDGYLLSMQRIPYGKLNKKAGKREPVLLQHGIMAASSDWVLNYPHQSLGFLLADMGYDVWLGNTRGGAYSRHHIKLKPTTSDFWNFSFDQIAEYDLPAMIDYILNKTKEENLIYIGHSQGTTVALALLSQNPIYNKKIKLFIALAPEAEMGHARSIVRYSASFFKKYLKGALKWFGMHEILPNSPIIKLLMRGLCASKSPLVCENILFVMYGRDAQQLNQTRLPVYSAHYPNGASTKSLMHFAQMVASKKFQKYDYGKENMKYYNQDTPPEYNVTKITAPVALFWGMNDALSDKRDIRLLEKKLKSSFYSYCVPWKNFNHVDFLLAKDARQLVYDEIMSVMEKFKKNKLPVKLGPLQRKTCH